MHLAKNCYWGEMKLSLHILPKGFVLRKSWFDAFGGPINRPPGPERLFPLSGFCRWQRTAGREGPPFLNFLLLPLLLSLIRVRRVNTGAQEEKEERKNKRGREKKQTWYYVLCPSPHTPFEFRIFWGRKTTCFSSVPRRIKPYTAQS